MELSRLLDQSNIIGEYKIKDSDFRALIDKVLERIPESYEDEFPTFCMYEGPVSYGAYVEEVGELFHVTFDVATLESESGGKDDVKIGVIAHELAHVFLEHPMNPDDAGGLDNEDEADDLASEWGFKDEIIAFRQKLGAATVESR